MEIKWLNYYSKKIGGENMHCNECGKFFHSNVEECVNCTNYSLRKELEEDDE